MKNAAIPKVKRTPEELLMSVKEQLQFLKDFCRMYDNGNYKYGVLIATRLRVLLYDSKYCVSACQHLKSRFNFELPLFMDTRNVKGLHFQNEGQCNYVSSFMCQYELKHYPDSLPILTPRPRLNNVDCYLNFEDWWKNATIVHWKDIILSREQLVCNLTNQDGGAHIDGSLSEDISDLKRRLAPALRIRIPINGVYKTYTAQSDLILYAIIRTIANETLIAFEEHIIPTCTKIYYGKMRDNNLQCNCIIT